MTEMNEAYTLRPGIVLTEIHGVYLLTADKEARKACAYIRELNGIGAFIWKRMEERKGISEIEDLLRQEYDIEENYDLRKDTEAFLQMLLDNHYILNKAEQV